MPTAFVLSGGGNLGAVQVGMVQALYERGVFPDLIVGSSVGAINAAWLAGHGPGADIGELDRTWRRLRRNDVFPVSMFDGVRGAVGRRSHLIPDSGLRRLVARTVPIRRIEEALIALHVVASDIRSGHDVLLSSGDVIDAVCASAAIPGVFPAVEIGGRALVDGGVVNNCPISHAVALGAQRIFVLPCGYACSLERAPQGALAVALQAITLLVQQRLRVDVERYRDVVDLHVVPCLCPVNVKPTDFSRSGELIDASLAQTRAWLGDPNAFPDDPLALHAHG